MLRKIIRTGICKPSKFCRPKLYALLCRLKGTSSDQPLDEIAKYNKCQISNSNRPPGSDEPFKRPTLHIEHSTVFAKGTGDDQDSVTLLESLRQKLASQTPYPPTAGKENSPQIETRDEAAEENKGKHTVPFSKDSIQLQSATINECDNKDNDLIQGPEPLTEIGDRRAVFEPPHIKAAHVRYTRYHQQCELQNEANMFDNMAKKYLVTGQDQIDKPLSRDMERFGLPMNNEEVSSTNINVHWEGEHSCEAHPQKPIEECEVKSRDNRQYYEQPNWCNQYFIQPNDTSLEIANLKNKTVEETRKMYGPDVHHNEMLPFNCCLDSHMDLDYLRKKEIDTFTEELKFDKHDDILPFHLLQCPEFIELDLTVKEDKVKSPINNLTINENLPIHFCSQGDVNSNYHTTWNEPVTNFLNNLMIHDSDVTKFEYTYSRDYSDLYSPLEQKNEEAQPTKEAIEPAMKEATQPAMKEAIQPATIEATQPIEGSDTILHIQSQTIPKTEKKEKEQAEPLSHTNLAETIVVKQETSHTTETKQLPEPSSVANLAETIDIKQGESQITKETTSNDIRPDHVLQISKPKIVTEEKLQRPLTVTEYVHYKVLEHLQASQRQAHNQNSLQQSTHTNNNLVEATVKNANEAITEPVYTTVQSEPPAESKSADITKRTGMAQAMEESQNIDKKTELLTKTVNAQNIMQPDLTTLSSRIDPEEIDEAVEEKHPSRGSETIAQSCVHTQTIPQSEAQKTIEPEPVSNIPKTLDDVNKKLDLNSSLSLSELLRRVRARNRLEFFNDINAKMVKTKPLNSKDCPPSGRPKCPPPPDCVKPCPPPPKKKPKCPPKPSKPRCPPKPSKPSCPPKPSKPKCPPKPSKPKCPPKPTKPKCPPAPSKPMCPPPPPKKFKCPPDPVKSQPKPLKCPPDPPKCPPNPPKCPGPPQKEKKCPPDPPKCPPDPPKCPPEPKKNPCPCPPPEKCPPAPKKCCQATDLNDQVTLAPHLRLLEPMSTLFIKNFIKSFISSLRTCLVQSDNRHFRQRPVLESDVLHLNRVRDFEPWMPIPSWPFPIHDKKRKVQCPKEGCPFPKPGPVRPNCPELPCGGFSKRLNFSENNR